MSELKLRLLTLRPTPANGAVLPAACALLLAAGAALQLALPQPEGIPADTGASRAPDWRLPDVASLPAPLAADRTSLFSPLRVVGDAPAAGTAAAAAPTGPLDGAFVLGAMRLGGQRALLLKEPGGRVIRMAPGGAWHGWRLLAIEDDAARFRKDGSNLRAEFGATAPAGSASEDDSSESEQ